MMPFFFWPKFLFGLVLGSVLIVYTAICVLLILVNGGLAWICYSLRVVQKRRRLPWAC